MKIGVYVAEPHPGGEINYIKSLIKALLLVKDFKVVVYITSESMEYFTDLIEIVSIKHTKNYNLRFNSSLIGKIKRRLIFLIGKSLNLIKIDCKDIDLFIFPYFAIESLFINVPYIIIPHDKRAFATSRYLKSIQYNNIYFRLKKALAIIVESNYVMEDILECFPVENNKIKIIISPPPLEDIKKTNFDLQRVKVNYKLPLCYLFYPAHIIPAKNHINLILAINKIKENYGISVNLVCTYACSNDAYFRNIKKLIKSLDLDKQVVFYKNIPYDDLLVIYKLSTALVMPTLFESISMPIWEAFYLGVPVVSSNVCALPEQVGDAGLLFDPNNIENIVKNIYKIWTDENLRQELVKKGHERIKELTLENYAKQWEIVIKEVLIYDKISKKNY